MQPCTMQVSSALCCHQRWPHVTPHAMWCRVEQHAYDTFASVLGSLVPCGGCADAMLHVDCALQVGGLLYRGQGIQQVSGKALAGSCAGCVAVAVHGLYQSGSAICVSSPLH